MVAIGSLISEIVSKIRLSIVATRVSFSPYGWVLLWEDQALGIWYIAGIWPIDLRYARVCQQSWFTLLLRKRNIVSPGVTPRSSSFEGDSGLGFGVSGEEVYVGSGVDREGVFRVYLPERSYVGNSKVLFERDLLVSREGGWFWPLVSFQHYADWP